MASGSIQPFGHNGHDPKLADCAPLGGAGSPSNTMWPGSKATSLPSFTLIHPTVRPQYTNVADRQRERTDRERSDSTERTIYERSPKNRPKPVDTVNHGTAATLIWCIKKVQMHRKIVHHQVIQATTQLTVTLLSVCIGNVAEKSVNNTKTNRRYCIGQPVLKAPPVKNWRSVFEQSSTARPWWKYSWFITQTDWLSSCYGFTSHLTQDR